MGVLADWQILREIKIEPFAESAMRPGVISYGVSSYGYDVRVARKFKVFGLQARLTNISDTQAAWIAGILDGEGYVGIQKAKPVRGRPLPRITVGMTCRETVEYLHQITGLGNITVRQPVKPQHNTVYAWNVTTTRHVQMLLTRILPYLVTKRQQALGIIQLDLGATGQMIVDPKNFHPDCFVDVEDDFCLIPPNSFALAETIEYLEIPRDILAICVGKSSLARCGIIVNVTPLEPEWRGKITIEISNTTPLPAKIYAGEGIAQILFLRAEAVCKTSYGDKRGKYQDQQGLTLPFVVGTEPES